MSYFFLRWSIHFALNTEYNKHFGIGENIATNEQSFLKFGVNEAVTQWYAESLLYKFDDDATAKETGK